MGFYDRDYYREDAPPQRFFGGQNQTCKRIIAVTVAVFVLQMVSGDVVTHWLDLAPRSLFSGEIWRFVTYAFCHSTRQPLHIIFNMLSLWWFGAEIENMYGSREFLKFYLAAAVVAGLIFCGIQPLLHQSTPVVGASGSVMAVLAVYTLYFPRRVVYVFLIPVELWVLLLIYVAFDLYPLLMSLGGTPNADQIAHSAHVGGLAYGLLYKHYNLRFDRLFGDLSWQSLRRSFRRRLQSPRDVKLYQPDESPRPDNELMESAEQEFLEPELDRNDLNQRVDEILAKISAHGEASLTTQERETLKEASRRFKHR